MTFDAKPGDFFWLQETGELFWADAKARVIRQLLLLSAGSALPPSGKGKSQRVTARCPGGTSVRTEWDVLVT